MNQRRKSIASAILLALSLANISADTVADITEMIKNGRYAEALSQAEEELTKNPKSSQAGTLSQLAGEAAFNMGDKESASAYFSNAMSKGVADAYRYAGKIAYSDLEIDKALELYSKYFSLKEKARKAIDPQANAEKERLIRVEDMLSRVEHIAIIDSLEVPKADFFKFYKMAASAGTLSPTDVLQITPNESVVSTPVSPVFTTSDGSLRLWAEEDANGNLSLFQSDRMTDGSWASPASLSSLSTCGNVAYPYLSADGATLYFASDGDDSIGGYDIFRANKDVDSGDFRFPVNIGLPYNSPANDYMLAFDEETGTGWWATDRNSDADCVTIYVFLPNSIRKNYDVDTPDIESLARIDDYSATTRSDDKDYSEILNAIKHLTPGGVNPDDEKTEIFVMPDGKVRSLSELQTAGDTEAIEAWQDWKSEECKFAELKSRLSELRSQYHKSSSEQLLQQISKLENDFSATRLSRMKARQRLASLLK